jgi:hypothetical protein
MVVILFLTIWCIYLLCYLVTEVLLKPNNSSDLALLTRKQSKELTHQILSWCIQNIHLNGQRKIKPTLNISYSKRSKYLGTYSYELKLIVVYIKLHLNLKQVCDTIIHEYVHHLQLRSIKDNMRYNKLTNQKSYWENDYEVEARYIASKYSKKCMKSLEFWWKKLENFQTQFQGLLVYKSKFFRIFVLKS